MAPLVSVILPSFRSASVIGRAVRSVLAQTRSDWELVVIDDASPEADGDAAIRAAGGDPRLHVERLARNVGAAQARNRGMDLAHGRYLAFLDADDEWLPHKLDRQLELLTRTQSPLVYSGFWRQGRHGRRAVRVPVTTTHAELLRGNVIGCLTAVVDRSAYCRPLRIPDLPRRQDYAFWLQLLRSGATAHAIEEPLAIHHSTPGSLSSARLAALSGTWAVYRRCEGLGRMQAARCLVSHLGGRLLRG